MGLKGTYTCLRYIIMNIVNESVQRLVEVGAIISHVTVRILRGNVYRDHVILYTTPGGQRRRRVVGYGYVIDTAAGHGSTGSVSAGPE